ncbi:glutathione S-transferase family protein [Burkholderia multivorans]|uniref:glutathione S-transferase family protein n=1 Tax=Burkholderia multivorans TaxID=87883 RepID=UPI00358E5FA2
MLPTLYAHPFSSYSQKVLTALYENGTPFDYRVLAHDDPAPMRELAALWPMKRFPVLVDAGRTLIEATIIVEYLDLNHPGPVRLLPDDPHAALDVRMMDRFFDNYVSTPQQKIVLDALRPPGERDARGVADARAMLDTAYAWLDARMTKRGRTGRSFRSARPIATDAARAARGRGGGCGRGNRRAVAALRAACRGRERSAARARWSEGRRQHRASRATSPASRTARASAVRRTA